MGEEEAKINNVIFDALKKNPNVPLYRFVYACIFCNILILWRQSQDEYALICVMFDHGMLKLISSLNVIVLFNIFKALLFNWHMFKLLWVGRIHNFHIELHLPINNLKNYHI